MEQRRAVWRLGVFRPLLHAVLPDARRLEYSRGQVLFAVCGSPVDPAPRPVTEYTVPYCPECWHMQSG
ncbi:MAG TPA: hypothetical protein VIL00_10240 [Pseudonocardiaceae bacterium]